MMDRFEEM